jgi:hypothetical protein
MKPTLTDFSTDFPCVLHPLPNQSPRSVTTLFLFLCTTRSVDRYHLDRPQKSSQMDGKRCEIVGATLSNARAHTWDARKCAVTDSDAGSAEVMRHGCEDRWHEMAHIRLILTEFHFQ